MRAALVAAVLLAGCSAPVDAPTAFPDHGLTEDFTFGLADFGSDAVAYSIVPLEEGTLRVFIDRDLQLSSGGLFQPPTPDGCMYVGGGIHGEAQFHVNAGDSVGAAVVGQGHTASIGLTNHRIDEAVVVEAPVRADEELVFQVGLLEAARWHELGGRFDVHVEAPGGMLVKRLPDPAFQCFTRPADGTSALWADTGFVRTAQDQTVRLPVDAPSHGLFLVSADGTFDYELQNGRGQPIVSDSVGLTAMAYSIDLVIMQPDDYAMVIHDLTGTNTVWPTMAVGLVIQDSPRA